MATLSLGHSSGARIQNASYSYDSPFYDFSYAVTCHKYYAMQIIACMLLVDATDEAEFIFILSV